MPYVRLGPETVVYEFCGLRIASNFPLDGLQIARDSAGTPCEVVIRRDDIPKDAVSTTARILNGKYSGTYNGKDLLLEFAGIGRFLIRGGEEIVMESETSSDVEEVRAFLLDVAFGVLCHQRGIAPLHASAIDLEGGCVAFVGASGAGKSTTIAALGKRGHEIIADDECFLKLDTDGRVQAWPGISRVRLWGDASAALGFDGFEIIGEMQRRDKCLVPTCPPRNPTACRPLRQVYQLQRIPTGVAEVIRLRGADAIEVLLQNLYPPRIATRLGYQSKLLAICAAAIGHVSVFRFSRPWDLATLDEGIGLLEANMRDKAPSV